MTTAILNSRPDRVERIEIGEPVYSLNNLLRTLRSLPIRLIGVRGSRPAVTKEFN